MPDTNDQFDLPRWHTSQKLSENSSPAYFYPHHVNSTDSHSSLARSASFSGTSSSTRGRRHSLLNSDSDSPHHMAARQTQPAFYPPQAAPYPPPPPASAPSDSYQDIYYPPKRIQPIDSNPQAARPARSPMRVPNTPLTDSYPQQPQYSPTNQFSYAAPPQSQYSHNRNLSHPKHEPLTPPIPPSYVSPPSAHPNAPYTSPFAMDTSSPHPPQSQTHLTAAQSSSRAHSLSNPSTPLSYIHSSTPQYYPDHHHQMAVDPSPPKRRASGFRRVRTVHDLQPRVDSGAINRRMTAEGIYLSPLRQLTTHLVETYHICNPQFRYESAHNPRRVLTKPSKPAHNDGYDNDDYDYILYVNDWLGTEEGHKYLILDILGQGTFGQVVKCQNMKTHEIVAVKVVKNKPAYFNQSMMEVTILELLNKNFDPNDEHHILRLRDSFIHRNHLCLVFELLSSNLYELIKQNQFQGLSTQLVKVFMAQLLDALTILKDARLIHCDLKPENILLKSLQSPQIKVIDFGSACHERQTVYTYIQSRFYRSPEVLLGMSYTSAIDMWSLGCIAVELFLGLPLFPGTSEYNQLTRIIDMLGLPPLSMLNTGKQVNQFFDAYEVWNAHSNQNERKYKLKSMDQYSREHGTNEQPGKQYFKATSLPEIVNTAPIPQVKSSRNSGNEVEKEMANRAAFIDFCQGLLNLNPVTRWTPQQARMHPFITGEKFTKPFVPDSPVPVSGHHPVPPNISDPKRPYGGLVPSQPKGTRAYFDAATYNHQLAQHQAYTAQAQAASQAANVSRNPYVVAHPSSGPQASPSNVSYQSSPADVGPYPQQQQQQQQQQHPQYGGQNPSKPIPQQQLTNNTGAAPAMGQYPSGSVNQPILNPGSGSGGGAGGPASGGPYFPNSRARANTINQIDAVPPALARLQHMNQDIIGGRNALTPVLNRDDAMREWERRQQGGKPVQVQPYPQLEYLQQQAEMAAAAGGMGGWAATAAAAAALGIHPHGAPQHNHRYPPPPSKLSYSYHPQTIMVDDEGGRRDAILSNVRSAARGDSGSTGPQQPQQQQQPSQSSGGGQQGPPSQPPQGGAGMYGAGSGGAAISISSPPQAYSSNFAVTGNRYAATYGGQAPPPPSQQQQQQQTQQQQQQQQQQHPSGSGAGTGAGGQGGGGALSAFDSIERRTDIGMFVPMQPDTYHHQLSQQYGSNSGGQAPARHVVPPQQTVPPSFYGAGVVPSGVTSTASQVQQGQGQGQGQGQQGQQRNPFTSMPVPDLLAKEARRGNGMDTWPR